MPITPPTPSTGDIYDIRMRFALGQSGWTETYRFASNGKGTEDDLIGVCYSLLVLRLPFLSSSAGVRRVSLVPVAVWSASADPPGYVKPTDRGSVPIPRDFFGNGTVDAEPFDPTSAVNLKLFAGNGLYRRVVQLRGFGHTSLRFSPTGSTSVGSPDAGERAALTTFYRTISNGTTPTGFGFGTFVTRGRSHDPGLLIGNIEQAGDDVTGCATVLTLDQAPPATLEPGDRVHVHNVRGCLTGNLNGDATVLDVGALNTVTIDKKNCCCQPYSIRPGGTLTSVEYGYYDYQTGPVFLQIPYTVGRRKTGAARLATRGRGRKRCK